MRRSALAAALWLTMPASAALAVNLTFDPGAYTGKYKSDFFGNQTGIKVFDIPADTAFHLRTGAGYIIAQLSVDAGGSVSVLSGSTAVTAGPATVTLQTVGITFDPGTFVTSYEADGVPRTSGSSTNQVPIDTVIRFNHAGGSRICDASISATGTVTITQNTTSCSSSGPFTLAPQLVSLTIDPGLYTGQYQGEGVTRQAGTTTQDVIVDSRIDLYIPGNNDIGGLELDAAGNVTIHSGTAYTSSGPNSLGFTTAQLDIDPSTYTGQYQGAGTARTTGSSVSHIPIGTSIKLDIPGVSGTICAYTIDAGRNLTLQSGATTCALGVGQITFNTVTVDVYANGYNGQWETTGHGRVRGDATADLPVDVSMSLWQTSGPEISRISVAADGTVSKLVNGHRIRTNTGEITLKTVEVLSSPTPQTASQRIQVLADWAQGDVTHVLLPEFNYTLADADGGDTVVLNAAADCAGFSAGATLNGNVYDFTCTVPACTAGEDALPAELVDGSLAVAADVNAHFNTVAGLIDGFGGVPHVFVHGTVAEAADMNANLDALRLALGLDSSQLDYATDEQIALASQLMGNLRTLANAAACGE